MLVVDIISWESIQLLHSTLSWCGFQYLLHFSCLPYPLEVLLIIVLFVFMHLSTGALLLLSVPAVYEKYQDHVDEKLHVARGVIQTQYRKIDDTVLRKIPLFSGKQKKIQ